MNKYLDIDDILDLKDDALIKRVIQYFNILYEIVLSTYIFSAEVCAHMRVLQHFCNFETDIYRVG